MEHILPNLGNIKSLCTSNPKLSEPLVRKLIWVSISLEKLTNDIRSGLEPAEEATVATLLVKARKKLSVVPINFQKRLA